MTPSAVTIAGEEQLGDDLDDARAADAGDAGARRAASAKPGSSDHGSTPMTRKRGSSVVAVDADPLDGAGRGALAADDLGALEGRAGRARRGEQPAPVAEHDLGVRADVDDERHPLGVVRLLGQDHAGRVGARRGRRCTAGRRPARPGWARRPSSAAVVLDGPIGRQRERRAAERRRVDAEQEVVHDRVADDRQLEDLGSLDAGLLRERGEQPVERLADRRRSSRSAPSGCIIAYETRLMRSSPKRICGFITPSLARTAPSARFARWPAIVVEPMSIATP